MAGAENREKNIYSELCIVVCKVHQLALSSIKTPDIHPIPPMTMG